MKKNEIKKQIYGNPSWVNGRINRAEYFWRCFKYVLLMVLMFIPSGIGLAFYIVGGNVLALGMAVFCLLLALLFYWRLIMTWVKRLHDLGWSGWWALLILGVTDYSYEVDGTTVHYNLGNYFGETVGLCFSVIGFIFGLLLLFKRGTVGVNKYGKDPLTKYEEGK